MCAIEKRIIIIIQGSYQVHRIDTYTDLSAMVVEGIGLHAEDISLLGSFKNYILYI